MAQFDIVAELAHLAADTLQINQRTVEVMSSNEDLITSGKKDVATLRKAIQTALNLPVDAQAASMDENIAVVRAMSQSADTDQNERSGSVFAKSHDLRTFVQHPAGVATTTEQQAQWKHQSSLFLAASNDLQHAERARANTLLRLIEQIRHGGEKLAALAARKLDREITNLDAAAKLASEIAGTAQGDAQGLAVAVADIRGKFCRLVGNPAEFDGSSASLDELNSEECRSLHTILKTGLERWLRYLPDHLNISPEKKKGEREAWSLLLAETFAVMGPALITLLVMSYVSEEIGSNDSRFEKIELIMPLLKLVELMARPETGTSGSFSYIKFACACMIIINQPNMLQIIIKCTFVCVHYSGSCTRASLRWQAQVNSQVYTCVEKTCS